MQPGRSASCEVFVLLDDFNATRERPSSRLYTGYAHQRRCTDPQTLDRFWSEVEADLACGLHAAVFIDYEWGASLQRAGDLHLVRETGDAGALRVLFFRQLAHLDLAATDQWLAQQDGQLAPSAAGVFDLKPSMDRAAYEARVQDILDCIRAGETYQVNFSYRLSGSTFGTPIGLYRRLRAAQPVGFGCLAALPVDSAQFPGAAHWVLSASPELFVQNRDGQLTARPMKGTAPRSADSTADSQSRDWLATDPKNLAENVMIVDLLRNDLGRISEIGSVQVPQLFTVESYRTVHQMTSTVVSRLAPEYGFPDVLRALFPCGSITGTPKLHTMGLIARLEDSPRNLYCGAIGWVDCNRAPQNTGNFCLSVAIRTLQLEPRGGASHSLRLGIGGGIVIDSDAQSEFEETQTKARFLTQLDPGFTLFETMLCRQGTLRQLSRHLARLQASAKTLGFAFDEHPLRTQLAAHIATLDPGLLHRVRLDLSHDGQPRITSAPLAPLNPLQTARTARCEPVKLVLAQVPVMVQERALLGHKTSLRSSYDSAIQDATRRGAFDAIFVNSQGQVTEGGRSNVLVKLNGQWCTPAISCGVLPGIMRERVLRLAPSVAEREISLDALKQAQGLAVCNALRGVLRAKWL